MITAPTIATRHVRLPGRLTLEIAERGDPNGVPVVLLHGLTDSWRTYELLLPELPYSMRAVAVSLRGHGESDRPPAGYEPRDFSGDIVALLDALEISEAVVVGHSMGSLVARRFAMDHPERTRRLALVGAFGRLAGRDDLRELAVDVAGLTDPIDPGFIREFQAGTVAGEVPSAFFETVVAESLKVPVRVFQDALAGMIADDGCGDLHRIACPTLLAWGDRDVYCSRVDQDLLVERIPEARLSVYAGVGHNPHWERAEHFARELAELAGAPTAEGMATATTARQ